MAKKPAVILNHNNRRFRDPAAFTEAETRIWILHEEGYTNREIAEKLNMTLGNVGMKLTICREKIAAKELA